VARHLLLRLGTGVLVGVGRPASRLHPQLAPIDVTHVTRVEGPDGSAGDQQLTLT
jgi:hypothetical protein